MSIQTRVTALAAAVGADIKALLSSLGGKVDKAAGQSLMTDAERTKLGGIAAGAQVNVATNLSQGTRTATAIPLTSSTGTGTTLPVATTALAGLQSAVDKTKLDGIATGAQVNVATNIGQGTRTSTGIPLTSSTGSGTTLPVATTALAGLESAADKAKLDGIAAGAQVNVATNLAESTRTATTVLVTSSTGNNATLTAATASLAGVMAAADKGKLDGIATGAQVNAVASVAGKTGAVVLAKADVGLSLVDNTSDIAKPVSTAQQTAINARVAISDVLDLLTSTDAQKPLSANQGRVLKGLIDNIQALLVSDDINLNTLQEIVDFIELNRATLNTLGIGNIAGLQAALDARYTKVEADSALSGKVDKVAGKQLSTEDFSTTEKTKLSGIAAGAQVNSVTSVAGRTGAVTLAKADVGLSNVDNTSDASKPVSTAQQTALDGKLNATANAVSASKLATARSIALAGDVTGSVSFDGSANATITAAYKNSGVAAGTYTKVTVDAKGNVTGGGVLASLDVPTLNQSTTGNAATATKLQTARTVALTGDVTGSATFDGSANMTITATVADDSHNHVIGNVDGLQAALDGKADAAQLATDVANLAGRTSTLEGMPGLGWGQTWQDLNASRALATTYTNTTGKPIQVLVNMYSTIAFMPIMYVDGLEIRTDWSSAGTYYGSISLIIPVGATYRSIASSGTPTLFQWRELR